MILSKEITHPSYELLHSGCEQIVKHFNELEYEEWAGMYYVRSGEHYGTGDPPACNDRVTRCGKEFALIVGIARGGLFPALVISHLLNVPMQSVFYSSKQGAGENKNHENCLPELSAKPYSQILIVDDIYDTGNTLAEVTNYYITQQYDISTAVLYYKEGSDQRKPDVYIQRIPKDAPWIVFPYETEME